ncbi:MAG TPA: MBL fold metallo-hydrolase [Caproicibacter sp.]|nr:MBL fold metallo-hydrolase [Caproicibacter sp.]
MENYRVRKIDQCTWQLEDLFRTYLYLIEGKEKAVLFDAGNGFSGLKEIVSSLTVKPVTVVLSHGHFDHTGCASEFEGCKICEPDIEVMKDGFAVQTRTDMIEKFCNLFHVLLPDTEMDYLIHAKAPTEYSFLKEHDVIELGGRDLEVITTPGHTKGSICLLDRDSRYLFSGDTVCNREILVYFDHSASVEDVKASDEKLLSFQEHFDEIWPGHHECPLAKSLITDYLEAAKRIIEDPFIGRKVEMGTAYKLLYEYKTIGISYLKNHVYR